MTQLYGSCPIHFRFQNFHFTVIICTKLFLQSGCSRKHLSLSIYLCVYLFLYISLSLFPFPTVLIWNLNSTPADLNKELQIKTRRKIAELVKVKNALHSLTKEHGSSIRCGGGWCDLLGGSKRGCSDEVSTGCKHRVIGKVASNTGSRGRKASCQTGQYISLQLIGLLRPRG